MTLESLPGLLFVSHDGGTKEVKELIAVCNDGVYGVTDEIKYLSPIPFQLVSAGKNFFIGTDVSGNLYSWGNSGSVGQLGQGICHQNLSDPHQIKHNARFVSISSGESFSLALDELGYVYAWGENYDRQLGLYTKSKIQMSVQNSMIEEVVYQPRIVSISQKFPVLKISCGLRYACVVTKTGSVYSWGAGECGQLGTGLCTRKEVPSQVFLQDTDTTAIVSSSQTSMPLLVKDIATGTGHVLVVSLAGEIYSWGLNSYAQLGLGHSKAKHYPCKLSLFLNKISDCDDSSDTAISDISINKVSAGGHSSAAIDNIGRLFTWGSTANDRLMHNLPAQIFSPIPFDPALTLVSPQSSRARIAQAAQDVAMQTIAAGKKITNIGYPTMVNTSHLTNRKVESFSFSKTHSTALVLTSFTKLTPAQGPKRSFNKLTLYGDGFWDSPIIIVKFTFKKPLINKSGFIDSNAGKKPPRSCSAMFVDPGTLVCKPPKFPEVGWFTVSISMDGVNFLVQTLDLLVHEELSVKTQLPTLLDMRCSKLDSLRLSVAGIPILPSDWTGNYDVRLVFSHIMEESNKHQQEDVIINTVASIVPPNIDAEQTNPLIALSEQDSITDLECYDIDLSCFVDKFDVGLYEMRSQISINGQDFSTFKMKSQQNRLVGQNIPDSSDAGAMSVNSVPSTLVYSFSPQTIYPGCIPIESNDRNEITVDIFGSGFIPPTRLSKGSHIVVTLTPLIESIKWDPSAIPVSSLAIANLSLNSLLVTAKCDTSSKLTCVLNSSIQEQIQNINGIVNAAILEALGNNENNIPRQFIEILPMKLSFDLQLPDRIIPLVNTIDYELKPLQINFYKNQQLLLIPNCMNLRNQAATTLSIMVNRSSFADGFDFISEDLQVAVHIPVQTEELSSSMEQKMYTFYPHIFLEKSQISVNEVKGPDESAAKLYLVQCEVKPLAYYLEFIKSTSNENIDMETIDHYSCMYISVLLDGKSLPPESLWAKITLYRDVAKQYSLLPAAPPKTGFTPGTSITLQLSSYIPLSSTLADSLTNLLSEEITLNQDIPRPKPQQCIISIRGASADSAGTDGAIFNFPAKLTSSAAIDSSSSSSSIEFIIPDGIRGIPGMSAVQKTPKDKPMFYVDISLDDGITFDKAEQPLLNLK